MVVLVADLVPHEQVFLVFLTNFILGFLFGVALGLVEVSLAERLVTGAHGPGEDVRSADVELPGGAGSTGVDRDGVTVTGVTTRTQSSPANRTEEVTITMEETIHGTTMPVLELSLQPGESIVSEAGEFSWMSDAIQMATNTGGGMGGKGIMGAVKRAVSGASFMMTTYTAQGGAGLHRLRLQGPGPHPAHRRGAGERVHGAPSRLHGGDSRGSSCPWGSSSRSAAASSAARGFILQKIGGTGRAFVDLSGEVIVYDLAAGQTMRVHPGHAGLFQASVTFSVQKVPGLANRYMGPDGHHFAVLTGPGRIWLQSMPIAILAGVIGEYMPDDHRGVEGAAVGVGAAKVLGDLFK